MMEDPKNQQKPDRPQQREPPSSTERSFAVNQRFIPDEVSKKLSDVVQLPTQQQHDRRWSGLIIAIVILAVLAIIGGLLRIL